MFYLHDHILRSKTVEKYVIMKERLSKKSIQVKVKMHIFLHNDDTPSY